MDEHRAAVELGAKTVFVIYRTDAFFASVGSVYSFDRQSKPNSEHSAAKVSLQRSLWSYVAEAVIEYCRISFDLFYTLKPVSILKLCDELIIW